MSTSAPAAAGSAPAASSSRRVSPTFSSTSAISEVASTAIRTPSGRAVSTARASDSAASANASAWLWPYRVQPPSQTTSGASRSLASWRHSAMYASPAARSAASGEAAL